jgi:purine-binding chemotaxis protein CheW
VAAVARPGQYSTFALGGFAIGIAARKVQEVLKHGTLTQVPLGPSGVGGLIDLRGQIVTTLDLAQQLARHKDVELRSSVVVRAGDETVSLLVEEVGAVAGPSQKDHEQVPPTVPAGVRE